MEKIFAVINLGSSYISGMLATKLPNGKINPIAYCRRNSRGCIIHGYIHNITETADIIGNIIDELTEKIQDYTIEKVYVGLDCQSMRSNLYKTREDFSTDGVILEQQHIDKLYEQALQAHYPRQSVLKITSPTYYIDGKREPKPKGVRCHILEASYQIITVREEIERNIYEVFEQKLGIEIIEILIAPIAEANITLTREEMSIGCAYINIGGGTTSISLYRDKLLQALYILPLGGNNVTKDLTNLKLLEQDAESIKIRYGSMNTEVDKLERITATSTNGTGDKILLKYDVNRYIQARMHELTDNIKSLINEIDPELSIAYIIFSGGATYLNGYMESLKLESNGRQATAKPDCLHEAAPQSLLKDYQTILGLIAQANLSCIKQNVLPLDEVFNTTTELTSELEGNNNISALSEIIPQEDEEEGNYIFDGEDDIEEEEMTTIEEEPINESTSDRSFLNRLRKGIKTFLSPNEYDNE